jgi:hypothetical protein
MTFLLTLRDYTLLTLWGWPGVLLALLAAFHLLERTLMPRSILSRRSELFVAAAILAFGLFSTWRGLSLPANGVELEQQLKQQQREAEERKREEKEDQAFKSRVESLRQELAGQRTR